MSFSPVAAKFNRRTLHKRSGMAAARALREGAEALPHGPARSMITKKARRAELCAVTQHHRLITPKDGASYLVSTNARACHLRGLCMNCEAMRANAKAADICELCNYVAILNPGVRYLMLTLTSVNRRIYQTRDMLIDHQKALKAFWQYDRLLTSTRGHVTSIEIDFANKNGMLFAHVHSHSAVAVDRLALSDHRYIRQAEYVALWRRALQVTSYKPIVDVRAIKGRGGDPNDFTAVRSAVREVIKYALDTDGYLLHDRGDVSADPQVAVAFALATHRRRLISMDRIFVDAKRARAKARKEAKAAEAQNSGA
jgi:hypothetical protein